MLTRFLILTLVALLALPIAEATHPTQARKRFKTRTITRTITSGVPIDIPNSGTAAPYPGTLSFNAFKRKKFKKEKIKDVNLTLRDFSHDRPDQVDILLVAPNGRNTLVMSDVGGNDQADNITLVLDDQALAALPLTSQLVSGTFRPTSQNKIDNLPAPAPPSSQTIALSVFNGGNPNGTWQLFVRDDGNMNDGEIGSWSLTIKAKVKVKKKRRR